MTLEELKLLGFEGGASEEEEITFGATAIQHGQWLINGVTHVQERIERLPKFVERHSVALCQSPQPFEASWLKHRTMLFRVRSDSLIYEDCRASLRANQDVLLEWKEQSYHFWLFPSFEALKAFGRPMAALLRSRPEKTAQESARVLDPWDGLTQEEWCDCLKKGLVDD